VGVNVTIPHKQAALALGDERTEAAAAIGAANTLTFSDGAIEAENTDAPGLLAALPQDPAGRTALVLGAGGSARAVVWALLQAGAADVMVWNRTRQRAHALCAQLGGRPVSTAHPADLLVNCTAVGLEPRADPWADLPLSPSTVGGFACVVDLVYGDRESQLTGAAREAGVETVDGLEVLVRQGALALERWTGLPAPLEAMRVAARSAG
jgi:shikimate dehydrogenase